jgi:C4-dicarboxylate transporter DctQ subunit
LPDRQRLDLVQSAFAGLSWWVGRTCQIVAAGLLAFMSVTLFLQVLFRYVLVLPLPWSEEAARFSLVWFAMLASCVAGQQGLHFVFRWGLGWMSSGPREAVRIVVLVLGTGVTLLLAEQGWLYLEIVSGLTATATRINMAWAYAAIPVGAFGLALIYLAELADAVMAPFTGRHLGVWRAADDSAHRQLRAGDSEC